MPRSEPEVPDADEEHVEESCGEDELREAYEYEVEDVDEDGGYGVLPLANFSEPSVHGDDAGEEGDDSEEVGFASPHAPHVGVDV